MKKMLYYAYSSEEKSHNKFNLCPVRNIGSSL